MINVLLVGDYPLVRSGIKLILEQMAQDIGTINEAQCGEEAVEIVASGVSEVVVIDVTHSGIQGIELIRRLIKTDSTLKILALIADTNISYARYCLEAGAAGCLTKRCDAGEMVRAVRTVQQGERYVSADVAQELVIARLLSEDAAMMDKLSARESQVMLSIVQGYSVREISDRLYLSPKTISTYKSRIYEKLGVNNDVELTHFAGRQGLLG